MKETKMLIYAGYVFILDRYIYESDEMFYFRINYIYKNYLICLKQKLKDAFQLKCFSYNYYHKINCIM